MGILVSIAVFLSMMVMLTADIIGIGENKYCYKACHEVMVKEKEVTSITQWWGVAYEYELCCRDCERGEE